MAVLKAPLFSLGASQQLGKALVFFGWKGKRKPSGAITIYPCVLIPLSPSPYTGEAERG
ncbi:hypothetical protein ES703_119120 [subsurface metagenome]